MTDEAQAGPVATGPGAPAFNAGASDSDLLLVAEPDEWARLVRVAFYHSTAETYVDRRLRPVRRAVEDDDQDEANRLGHDLVTTLRHNYTSYPELVAHLVDAHGYGAAQNAVDVLRHRVLRAIAYAFPPLAPFCKAQAADREPQPYELPASTP